MQEIQERYGNTIILKKIGSWRQLTGYDMLAIAICGQAAKDYRIEIRKSVECGEKTMEAKKIEKFFLSEYVNLLSFGQGKQIIKRLQRNAAGVRRIDTNS